MPLSIVIWCKAMFEFIYQIKFGSRCLASGVLALILRALRSGLKST